ncbi:hypothetical protein [Sphingomonas aerolata]|uniref:hypothetical protein n=1 Tax=Sphingomonas aerolata TaxID=185951 RepID=UPI000D36EAE3|nr:hypothetical protein [Sphingomonas aerolata]
MREAVGEGRERRGLLDGEPRFRRGAQLLGLRDLGAPRRSLGLQRCLKVIGTCSRQQQADEQASHRH